MGWVHRYRRCGAYLALAALWLQIAISFGHVDLDGAVIGDHSHKIVIAAKTSQQTPAQNNDDGYCPICASIFLVSTSFVSTPPALPVPDGFQRIAHSVAVTHGISPPLRLAFRSRAPPSV